MEMLIYHRNLWYIMSAMPPTQTGNINSEGNLRRRFINAELIKAGGSMDVVTQKYTITKDLIDAWLVGDEWYKIKDMEFNLDDDDSIWGEKRKYLKANFLIMRNGLSRLNADFAGIRDRLVATGACPTCGEILLESNHGLCFTCSVRRGNEVHKKYANGGSS